MMDYGLVKYLHVACVVLSIALFLLRGGLQLQSQAWREWRVLRVAPHYVDTVLLGSALWLAWRSAQYPFVAPWLTAKVLALLLYIVLGHLALTRSARPGPRLLAFVAAVLCVLYIVGVALTRSPTWHF